MSPLLKSIIAWVAILMTLFLVAWMVVEANRKNLQVTYSTFLDMVAAGEVSEITMSGREITGERLKEPADPKQSKYFTTRAPEDDRLISQLREAGVVINVDKEPGSGILTNLIVLLPLLVIIGLWIFFMRQMQGSGAKAMSFGKSRAKLLSSHAKKVTFKDVAGCDEAKEELQEIIEFLKDPQKFAKLGGKIPTGVLLVGAPGTGKTLMARAIAGEASVPFFSLSGSDFVEMFVGVGASRVRDLFEQGKKNAPCIIFIDEIDAVGRHRGAGLGGGHDEREQTLNALLVEMDGFETNEGVIIISATNRPDVLDRALLRPGRFDRQVTVGLPDVRGREGILKVHTRKIPIDESVDLRIIARATPGMSGADLANLVNEAALLAARADKKAVDHEDFEAARDKVTMGLARKSMVISDREKRITAFHEAGHALTAALCEHAQPVHKITIIPHAMALGLTQMIPEEERHTWTQGELSDHLCMLMGGRAAERLVFDEVTTGAADDIKKATDIARRMVSQWGMSETLGPIGFEEHDQQVFLGRDISRAPDYSQSTAEKIDGEVRRIVNQAWETTSGLLRENRDLLESIAINLLERETLGAKDFRLLLDGKELPPLPEPEAEPEPRAESDEGDEGEESPAASGPLLTPQTDS